MHRLAGQVHHGTAPRAAEVRARSRALSAATPRRAAPYAQHGAWPACRSTTQSAARAPPLLPLRRREFATRRPAAGAAMPADPRIAATGRLRGPDDRDWWALLATTAIPACYVRWIPAPVCLPWFPVRSTCSERRGPPSENPPVHRVAAVRPACRYPTNCQPGSCCSWRRQSAIASMPVRVLQCSECWPVPLSSAEWRRYCTAVPMRLPSDLMDEMVAQEWDCESFQGGQQAKLILFQTGMQAFRELPKIDRWKILGTESVQKALRRFRIEQHE